MFRSVVRNESTRYFCTVGVAGVSDRAEQWFAASFSFGSCSLSGTTVLPQLDLLSPSILPILLLNLSTVTANTQRNYCCTATITASMDAMRTLQRKRRDGEVKST
jgi:hypothetical protein